MFVFWVLTFLCEDDISLVDDFGFVGSSCGDSFAFVRLAAMPHALVVSEIQNFATESLLDFFFLLAIEDRWITTSSSTSA